MGGVCFCGRPLPTTAMCVMWCDECLDEWWATGEGSEPWRRKNRRMEPAAFIAMKLREVVA